MPTSCRNCNPFHRNVSVIIAKLITLLRENCYSVTTNSSKNYRRPNKTENILDKLRGRFSGLIAVEKLSVGLKRTFGRNSVFLNGAAKKKYCFDQTNLRKSAGLLLHVTTSCICLCMHRNNSPSLPSVALAPIFAPPKSKKYLKRA